MVLATVMGTLPEKDWNLWDGRNTYIYIYGEGGGSVLQS